MSRKRWFTVGVAVLILGALVVWVRPRVHFDFAAFRAQLAMAAWGKIGLALACIYVGYIIRSVRWALLVRHNRRVPAFSLIGTQVMGFTAVALIGRVADLARPYLVARKTGLPLSSQVAVYIVERLFDAGSMGLILSLAILGLPASEISAAMNYSHSLAALSHSHPEVAQLLFRYGGLLLTALGALFLVGVRMSGETIAAVFERGLGLVSKNLGRSAGDKIRTFHTGLDVIHSAADLAATASLSVLMWGLIAASYFLTMRAFVASPVLAAISPAKSVLLMVISGGASIVQLPVLGWFTQIGIVSAAISGFFSAAPEAAVACAACLLGVTFLGILPVGLVWAQVEEISLRGIAAESEHARERLVDHPAASGDA